MCLLPPIARTTATCSETRPRRYDIPFVNTEYIFFSKNQWEEASLGAHNVERVLNILVKPKLRLDIFVSQQSFLLHASVIEAQVY